MKTPADVARQAADVIRERGWVAYELEDSRGHVCALGGLRVAAFGAAESAHVHRHTNWHAYRSARDMLAKVMREQLDLAGRFGIGTMNDQFVHSGEELIGYMEKAAARLEEVT